MRRSLFALVLGCVLVLPGAAAAQIAHGGTPPSLDPEIAPHLRADDVPVEILPFVDVDALEAEDELNDAVGGAPWRYGQPVASDVSLATHGAWTDLNSGARVWRLYLHSAGATSLDLAFDRFVLPAGARFYVLDANGTDWIGAFTEHNNKEDGRFSTEWLHTDELLLELLVPPGAAAELAQEIAEQFDSGAEFALGSFVPAAYAAELELAYVVHGYRTPRAGADAAFNNSGACMNNINCPEAAGWEDPSRGVAMISMGGGLCSGSLINNSANDGTPLFLTANHCWGSNASWWTMHFNYEAEGCSNPSWDPDSDTISGASNLASGSGSDFALFELSSDPPASYGVYFPGWSRSSSAPTVGTCIHHPGGDIKKWSQADSVWPDGSYWGIGPWDDGVTEGGSSGSPLFDQNKRIVGQLYGGSSYCWGSQEDNGTDIYGRLDVSWSSGLSSHLDPIGSGATSIDGFDPNVPLSPIDADVTIVEPSDGSVTCEASIGVQIQLTNDGTEPLTSVAIDYRADGGAWQEDSWSGTLAPGASTVVSLATLTPGGGSHELEVEVSVAGDENPTNDVAVSEFSVAGGGGATGVDESFGSVSFPPSGWQVVDPDGAEAWQHGTSGGGSAYFNNFDDDYRGEVDYLYTPFLDLTSTSNPTLTFDVAYARYNGEYTDGMQVHVSADCGDSWSVVYDKEGTQLATAPDHGEAFVPTSGEWRTESISLASWASSDSVLVAFANVTGYGNNLFVDNVSVGTPSPGDDDDDGPGDDDDDPWGDDDDDGGDDDDSDGQAGDDDDGPADDDDGGDGEPDDDDGGGDLTDDTSDAAVPGKMYAVTPYCGCQSSVAAHPGSVFAALWLLALLISGRRRA